MADETTGMGAGSEKSRLIAIGDVHGCADELDRLLTALSPTVDDELVFLGDYVDRGPASSEVLDIVVQLRASLPRAIFLRGNHEEMMLDYLGFEGSHGEFFLRNGGERTLASYGLDGAPGAHDRATAVDRLPPEHLEFLRSGLTLHHRSDRFTFVHAGVRPGVPLEEQSINDLLWIREPFLSRDHGLATTVVFGHTPRRAVFLDLPGKIGLDTGAVYGGRLSAIDFTAGLLHQVEAGGRRAEKAALHPWFS